MYYLLWLNVFILQVLQVELKSLHRYVYKIDIQSQAMRDYIIMGFVMFHRIALLFCRWSVKCTGQRTIMNLNSTEILLWRLSPTQPSTFMTLESLKLNWSVLYYLHIESSDINLTKKVLMKDIISIVKACVIESMWDSVYM